MQTISNAIDSYTEFILSKNGHVVLRKTSPDLGAESRPISSKTRAMINTPLLREIYDIVSEWQYFWGWIIRQQLTYRGHINFILGNMHHSLDVYFQSLYLGNFVDVNHEVFFKTKLPFYRDVSGNYVAVSTNEIDYGCIYLLNKSMKITDSYCLGYSFEDYLARHCLVGFFNVSSLAFSGLITNNVLDPFCLQAQKIRTLLGDNANVVEELSAIIN